MSKLLYFDVETTGLSPVKNDIIQFACIIEIDGEVKEEFEVKIKPFDFTTIQKSALEVTGMEIEDLYGFTPPKVAFMQIQALFAKYIDRMDKNDKFIPVAYNGKFDLDFLGVFWKKNGNDFFGAWQDWQLLDPLVLWRYYKYVTGTWTDNNKLSTVCDYFGIKFTAHDALEDIRATRTVHKLLSSMIRPFKNGCEQEEQIEELYNKNQLNLFEETNEQPVT